MKAYELFKFCMDNDAGVTITPIHDSELYMATFKGSETIYRRWAGNLSLKTDDSLL